MRKLIAVILGLIGLAFVVFGFVNMFARVDDVTALAEDYVDMPTETYTLQVNQNARMFSCVSPYGWSDDMGSVLPSFAIFCYNDVFVLGTVENSSTTIPNELEFIQRFDLSTSFDIFTEVTGFYDDYNIMSNTFRVRSTFTSANSNYTDFVCFQVRDYTQNILIHIKDLNRYYTITITSEDGPFSPVYGDTVEYFYNLSYYDLDTLFQNGYQEGYNTGKAEGLIQGEETGFNKGYQQGVEEGFDGDFFGSSIVPSINSLLLIEIVPGISFSTVLSISWGLILVGIAIKVFLGG